MKWRRRRWHKEKIKPEADERRSRHGARQATGERDIHERESEQSNL